MPLPADLNPELEKLIFGTPWGRVNPKRANPQPLPHDGRTVALRILRKYISELTFFRPAGRDPQTKELLTPIGFKIPERDINIGWPDYEKALNFPSITFLHALAEYKAIGLAGYIEEDTRDRYGIGTVLQWQSEYTEEFILELWANKKAELRSILGGIETALSPSEQMYGIRFTMPDYFNEFVCFTIANRQEMDEEDGARNRRRARLTIEMRFNVVALVNYVRIQPMLDTRTDVDPITNIEICDGELAPSAAKKPGECDPCG